MNDFYVVAFLSFCQKIRISHFEKIHFGFVSTMNVRHLSNNAYVQ